MRTAMSYGITNIHFVQSYDNLITKMPTKINKVNSGSIKWMNTKTYNHLNECIDSIKEKYDPIFICTDISKDSINILDFDFNKHIHSYDEKMKENSVDYLNDLLFYNLFTREKIKSLKDLYKSDIKDNTQFIKNIYMDGHFLCNYYI